MKEEYFDYLVTSNFQKEQEGTFAEPVQVSGNVTSAVGVFAGCNYSIYALRP
ncbi:MAG: DUF4249 family protein [Cyclobacteriaceae bacterium]|nr:DUF4249 family protein [Cyclobacteriaceae bacterium HetDA_MAG_MS6]